MAVSTPHATIRRATAADFEWIYGLYFHPTINPFLLYEPMSATDFKPIFEDLLGQKSLFVFERDHTAVGMFKLYAHRFRCSHIAYLGGLALAPEAQGKGLATDFLHHIVAYAQAEGFKRVELSVATHNLKAIRTYEKVGFVAEGVMRAYTYLAAENTYIDEMLMAVVF